MYIQYLTNDFIISFLKDFFLKYPDHFEDKIEKSEWQSIANWLKEDPVYSFLTFDELKAALKLYAERVIPHLKEKMQIVDHHHIQHALNYLHQNKL